MVASLSFSLHLSLRCSLPFRVYLSLSCIVISEAREHDSFSLIVYCWSRINSLSMVICLSCSRDQQCLEKWRQAVSVLVSGFLYHFSFPESYRLSPAVTSSSKSQDQHTIPKIPKITFGRGSVLDSLGLVLSSSLISSLIIALSRNEKESERSSLGLGLRKCSLTPRILCSSKPRDAEWCFLSDDLMTHLLVL